jgi:hypothetical protein
MQFGCRMVMIAVAASAAGADGGGKHRTLAATPPAAAAIPIQPPQERKARPDDDLPPELVIRGKVVDIETGRPITHFFLQQGEPDPDDPSRTNWNAGESWSSENPGGSLDQSYTEKGEWWRVVAPGYVPQPLTEKPYDGRPGIVNVTVKLRRGWRIAGLVVDPSRKPVAGASVFLVGGRMMEPNITGGKAWERSSNFMRSEDKNVTKAVTDGDGRFVLDAAGGYETAIAVSSAALDLWIHQPVPALGKSCEIVLPAPCKLVVRYRIEGAEPDAIVTLFSQHDLWNVAVNERELKVPNGGQIAIENLMPGRYRVQR